MNFIASKAKKCCSCLKSIMYETEIAFIIGILLSLILKNISSLEYLIPKLDLKFNSEIVMVILLPVILFADGYCLEEVKKVWKPIFMYGIIGTIIYFYFIFAKNLWII